MFSSFHHYMYVNEQKYKTKGDRVEDVYWADKKKKRKPAKAQEKLFAEA